MYCHPPIYLFFTSLYTELFIALASKQVNNYILFLDICIYCCFMLILWLCFYILLILFMSTEANSKCRNQYFDICGPVYPFNINPWAEFFSENIKNICISLYSLTLKCFRSLKLTSKEDKNIHIAVNTRATDGLARCQGISSTNTYSSLRTRRVNPEHCPQVVGLNPSQGKIIESKLVDLSPNWDFFIYISGNFLNIRVSLGCFHLIGTKINKYILYFKFWCDGHELKA